MIETQNTKGKKAERIAIIPAAGLSSRMGSFKPLLKFGESTVIGTIIDTLMAAEISKIIVVTGRNAKELKKEIQNHNTKVYFVHNENYENSHMFDSILLGLGMLKTELENQEVCVGIWPVDVPAVDKDTVNALFRELEEKKYQAVIPVHNGSSGHPVIFSAEAVKEIINHDGTAGLNGAIKKLHKVERIEVPDPFVLIDIDTPKEYDQLKRQTGYDMEKLDFSIKVSMKKDNLFFSFGLVELLVLTDKYQSLRRACEEMEMSYSKGWGIIKKAEKESGIKFLDKQIGGVGGGGSSLTAEGKNFLRNYNLFCEEINLFAQDIFEKYFGNYIS